MNGKSYLKDCRRRLEATGQAYLDNVHHIDPRSVRVTLREVGFEQLPRIRSISETVRGSWSDACSLCSLTGLDIYAASVHRFLQGGAWSETEFYKRVWKRIQSGESKFGCRTIAEFHARLEYDEELFLSLRRYGYKSQRDLGNDNALDEVLVARGHDGALILLDGRHRLIYSQLLELPSIPVTVLVKHKTSSTQGEGW